MFILSVPGLFLNARLLNASSSLVIEKSTNLVIEKSTDLVIGKSTKDSMDVSDAPVTDSNFFHAKYSMDVSEAPVTDSNFFHASVPLSALPLESPLRCSILSSKLVELMVDENISCMHQNDIVMLGAPTQAQLDDRM